jgi:hypothetical protein
MAASASPPTIIATMPPAIAARYGHTCESSREYSSRLVAGRFSPGTMGGR